MTIVYTTIFGGSDSLKPAPTGADRCVCFVDEPAAHQDAKGWDLLVSLKGTDPRRQAWRLRCLAHELFPDAARTVWIDASFTLTDLPRLLRDAGKASIAAIRHHKRSSCYEEAQEIVKVGQAKASDVMAQMAAYRDERFHPSALSISCVIVRDHSTAVEQFNETWRTEIDRWSGDNTQLSLDYSAWKAGLTIAALSGTRHANPYATHDHVDHKKRRQPYRSAA